MSLSSFAPALLNVENAVPDDLIDGVAHGAERLTADRADIERVGSELRFHDDGIELGNVGGRVFLEIADAAFAAEPDTW